jgi:catechol 2,3-dioxygenase-like lactoylglutathione lyase family enzyme
MLTGVGHLEMRVRDFTACRAFYGPVLGLPEIAHGVGVEGLRTSMFATGASVLEMHEDPLAVSFTRSSGKLMPKSSWADIPGSINHIAFYVDDNDEVYEALSDNSELLDVGDKPAAQALGHTYLQRSLLEYRDPSGLTVQIAQIVDPRADRQPRSNEKNAIRTATARGGLLHGFDHISIYITDTRAARSLFSDKLGLREYGEGVVEGRKQSVFAVGLTDLELNENEAYKHKQFGPGIISRLGFWTDDVEQAYKELKAGGLDVDGPPSERIPLPGMRRLAFFLKGPDGLPLEIAQRI